MKAAASWLETMNFLLHLADCAVWDMNNFNLKGTKKRLKSIRRTIIKYMENNYKEEIMDISKMTLSEAKIAPWQWEEGEEFSIIPTSEESKKALLSHIGPEGCYELAKVLKELADEDIESAYCQDVHEMLK